jgi:pimeloyl-ACP methyl ester carboxylesterase
MPVVLVHGVPDTHRLWDHLRIRAAREVAAGDVEKVTRPALVLWSRDDHYVGPGFAERLAARVRGELVKFDGCGHWWPYERPAEAAAALEQFWSGA